MVQWLGLSALITGIPGSITGWGTKSHKPSSTAKKKKKKDHYITKFTTVREKAIWATGSTKVLKAERRDGAPANPLLNLRLVPNSTAQGTLD